MAAKPIKAPCSRKYRAFHHSGDRHRPPIWVIVHSTEADTAESSAVYFTNPNSGGSAHLVVDDNECFRTLDDQQIPWAAPGANEKGYHIEQAGHANWSVITWMRHRKTVQRAAYKAALRCHRFHIPAVWLEPDDLKRGKAGVSSHANCTTAFGPTGGHSDPGSGWPRRYFMRQLRNYLKEMNQ